MWLSDVCHHLDCKGEVGQDLAGLTRASTWTALSGTSLIASAIFAIRSGILAGVKNESNILTASVLRLRNRGCRDLGVGIEGLVVMRNIELFATTNCGRDCGRGGR